MNSAENGKEVAGINLVESFTGRVKPCEKPSEAALSGDEPGGRTQKRRVIRTIRKRSSLDAAGKNAADLSVDSSGNGDGQALNPEADKGSDRDGQGLNPAAGAGRSDSPNDRGSASMDPESGRRGAADNGIAETKETGAGKGKRRDKKIAVVPAESGSTESGGAEKGRRKNKSMAVDPAKSSGTEGTPAETQQSIKESHSAEKPAISKKHDSAEMQAVSGAQDSVETQTVPDKSASVETPALSGKHGSAEKRVAPGKQDSAEARTVPGKPDSVETPAVSREHAPGEKRKRVENLEAFGREIFPFLDLKPFHRAYYRVLEAFARGRIRKLMISMPPQHGKSLGATTLLPAYLLGLNPDLRVAIASYSASLASKFNRRVQRILESKEYRAIFPDTTIKHGTRPPEYIRTSDEVEIIGREGSLLSVGREGSLTGNRVDCFILDDLYKDALEANSPLVRENCREWYTSVVKTRMHNDSSELLVFTRWHEEDLIGDLQRAERVIGLRAWEELDDVPAEVWVALNFEAVKQSEATEIDPRQSGEALWPERQSVALLEAKRRLDPVRFEAMYQGHPSSAEGLLYGNRFQSYETLPEAVHHVGNYTDTADTGEDYLCSLCYVAGADGAIYITDAVYTREAMEVTELAVSEMLRRNGTRRADIESNNGGRGFARAVQRLAPETAVDWFHQSGNKEARILSHSATVLHRLRWPAGWAQRWPELHTHLVTYRRKFNANRWHDAADVVTGIVERECSAAEKKGGRIRFL